MHSDEYIASEKEDLQARLWNQFVRPNYIAELDMDQRRNQYTCAIIVTEEMVQNRLEKIDRRNKFKEQQTVTTAADKRSSMISENSQLGARLNKTSYFETDNWLI